MTTGEQGNGPKHPYTPNRGCVCFPHRAVTRSSSGVPGRPTPTPVCSRRPPCSCCCWTVCGSCGTSSPWPWASQRTCSSGWPQRPMPQTMAPSSVTATGRGQSLQSWVHVDTSTRVSVETYTQRFSLQERKHTFTLFLQVSVCVCQGVPWEWRRRLTVFSRPCWSPGTESFTATPCMSPLSWPFGPQCTPSPCSSGGASLCRFYDL